MADSVEDHQSFSKFLERWDACYYALLANPNFQLSENETLSQVSFQYAEQQHEAICDFIEHSNISIDQTNEIDFTEFSLPKDKTARDFQFKDAIMRILQESPQGIGFDKLRSKLDLSQTDLMFLINEYREEGLIVQRGDTILLKTIF
ncbi:MAG: hypothetical protein ABEI32_00710 [Halothece sp.]